MAERASFKPMLLAGDFPELDPGKVLELWDWKGERPIFGAWRTRAGCCVLTALAVRKAGRQCGEEAEVAKALSVEHGVLRAFGAVYDGLKVDELDEIKLLTPAEVDLARRIRQRVLERLAEVEAEEAS